MGPGPTGREFIHGLTRERDFAVGELGPSQTQCRQNWAIAFYNPTGGYALGQIWRRAARGGAPELGHLPFPGGTVVAKLVFTEATVDDWPLLAGAPEIDANIHVKADAAEPDCALAATASRAPHRLPRREPFLPNCARPHHPAVPKLRKCAITSRISSYPTAPSNFSNTGRSERLCRQIRSPSLVNMSAALPMFASTVPSRSP